MANDVFEVCIVKYGTRTTTKSDVYLNFHIYGLPDAPIDMAYYFWVLRNDATTVVVDTGFSENGARARERAFLVTPQRALELLDIDPAAGPPVVITHAHYDHIGNLDLFNKSQITLSRNELEFWLGPLSQRRQYQHLIEANELQTLAAAHDEGRVNLFDGRHLLAPGIELVEVGGHTPGQVMVKVNTSEGAVLLTSDAVHYYEEYERDMPFIFVSDLRAMYQSFDLIHSMVATREVAQVVSGHDPDTMNRFRIATEGPLAGLLATIGDR